MYYLIIDKLKGNFLLFSILVGMGIIVANVLSFIDLSLGVFVCGLLIMILIVRIVFYNPIYAVVFNWFCSFLLFFFFYRIMKITSLPLGFLIDGLNVLAIIALLVKGNLSGFGKKLGIFMLVWLVVCLIELVNPFAASRGAWFQAIRGVLNFIIPFFVILSLLKTKPDTTKILVTTWVTFATLAALYTLVQEFAGYPPWDYAFITRDERYFSLLYTFGRLRKISFLSGPMENGVVLALNAVFCLGLAFQVALRRRYKLLYLFLALLSAWAMLYTGTRTATVIFVMGLAVYVVVSRRKELLIYTAIGTMLIFAYIAVTGGGQALYVMTTAFSPDEDPSMQVRYDNQKIVRGYIMKSPIGYGLGSTGHLGQKFSPNTFLGQFPPDSELVRIAIETGSIGLAIWMIFQFFIMSKTLDSLKYEDHYYRRNLRKVIVAILFMFLLGQYPQEILNIQCLKILFAFCLAFVSLEPEEFKKQSLNA